MVFKLLLDATSFKFDFGAVLLLPVEKGMVGAFFNINKLLINIFRKLEKVY